MTPDELREKIERAIGAKLVPTSYAMAIKYELADAVMPVLAEALAERDLALWLHAETTWRYDTSIRDCAHVLIAQRDGVAETLGMLHDTPMGDLCDAIRLLRWLHAEAEWKRERLSTLLRGMARRCTAERRVHAGTAQASADREYGLRRDVGEARAELAERAVVLPEDWRKVLTGVAPEAAPWIVEWIESWRPSTGDTAWYPQPGDLVTGKARNAHDRDPVGRYVDTLDTTARIDVTDAKQADYPNMVSSLAYVDADTLRPAALPEGTPAETTYRSSGTVQRGLHARGVRR